MLREHKKHKFSPGLDSIQETNSGALSFESTFVGVKRSNSMMDQQSDPQSPKSALKRYHDLHENKQSKGANINEVYFKYSNYKRPIK
jgi:hypothetical protein